MLRALYVALILLLVGCVPVTSPDLQENIVDTQVTFDAPKHTVRFLALGDSYTIGQGVSDDERWPEQLAVLLSEQGIDMQVSVIARTGWTTNDLLDALSERSLQEEYDLVSLLIGVNDQYRGGDLETYRIRFQELLGQAIMLAGNDPQRVIVLSIPDWEVTPFASQLSRPVNVNRIDDFNAVNLQAAQAHNVHYVDITPISRRVNTDEGLLAPDGLHPSGVMYAFWVDEMLQQILEMLR